VAPYAGLPALHFAHNAESIDTRGDWYHSFEYAAERERGLDFEEDLFQPLTLHFRLGTPALVIASTEVQSVERFPELRGRIGREVQQDGGLVGALRTAADQFIVRRGEGRSVIAGYPWFGDWGRDTMISLPGLTLVTGRSDTARCILLDFREWISDGMLPNYFPDAGEAPAYNTVDATLWMFEAVRALVAYTQDFTFVRTQLYGALKDIIGWHTRGTRYGIRVERMDCWSAAVRTRS
jgi:Glycogen debranching enzyme